MGSEGDMGLALSRQETAYLLGGLGSALAVGLATIGGAIGTAKAGKGLASMRDGASLLLALVPVVMSGIVSIYGLILAVIIKGQMTGGKYSVAHGAFHLASGLAVGLPCLAAGWAVGCIAQRWLESNEEVQGWRMILVLIFAEALGLYGLIVGLLLAAVDV